MIKSLFKGSIQQSVIEFTLIIVGVLVALWVDDWRASVAEKKSVQQHLVGIVAEVDVNRWTLHRIRDEQLATQIAALEKVIRILNETDPQIDDPEDFIDTLITSAESLSPWFSRNSFESFKSSEDYHSSHIQGLATSISSTYEALSTLYYQRFENTDPYNDAVSRFVPARYQQETNEMRGYTPSSFLAPMIADEEPVSQTIAAIVGNRTELIQLARYKAKRITGKWYAMTRIILQYQYLKDEILDHPLMRGVDVPVSELTAEVEGWRI